MSAFWFVVWLGTKIISHLNENTVEVVLSPFYGGWSLKEGWTKEGYLVITDNSVRNFRRKYVWQSKC